MFQLFHKISYLYSHVRTRVYRTLQENRFSFIFEVGVSLSAAIGVLFIVVFFGMKLDLFTVRGSIDQRNEFFKNTSNARSNGDGLSKDDSIKAISEMQFALKGGISSARKKVFPDISFAWSESEEWKTLASALTKDRETIRKAAYGAGISPRVLVSIVIAEQLRFFTSDRESFKKFFEPLKILGTLSEFSLGVSGVKQDTAEVIERNLKDKNSPYYIGSAYEHLLDVSVGEAQSNTGENTGTSSTRFLRLTDSKDHYYSYLYTALFARQVMEQWKKEGYDLSYRPEILATLFNLGFEKSVPKPNPKVAGAEVSVGGETYTFGRLAYEFYYSGELVEIFGF
ncbi:MAG: hypothetical protein KBC87_01770 [Candidatus Pacebacteria bacterium]|nr:hypothetical protein [Candidatus Paceibacterota bacterium]